MADVVKYLMFLFEFEYEGRKYGYPVSDINFYKPIDVSNCTEIKIDSKELLNILENESDTTFLYHPILNIVLNDKTTSIIPLEIVRYSIEGNLKKAIDYDLLNNISNQLSNHLINLTGKGNLLEAFTITKFESTEPGSINVEMVLKPNLDQRTINFKVSPN